MSARGFSLVELMVAVSVASLLIIAGFTWSTRPSATLDAKSVLNDVVALANGARALYAGTDTGYRSLTISDAYFHRWVDGGRFRQGPRRLYSPNTGGQFQISSWAAYPAQLPTPAGMTDSEGFMIAADFSDSGQCQAYYRLAATAYPDVWIGTTRVSTRDQGFIIPVDRRDALCPDTVYISSY